MRIAVLICEAIDNSSQLIFDTNEKRVWAKSIYKKINLDDSVALEVACRVSANTGSYVESLTLGSPASVSLVRQFVLPRVSKSVIIVDDERSLENSDSYYAAAVLGGYLSRYRWDMIFCGNETSDYGGGMTGPVLSASLNSCYVGNVVDVVSVDVEKRVTRVKTKKEWGKREVLEIPLPVILGFEPGEVDPQVATFDERLGKLDEAPDLVRVEEVNTYAAIKKNSWKVDIHKTKPRGIFVPDSFLSPVEKVRAIMSGGLSNKKGQFVTGTAEQIVDRIVSFLTEKQII